MVSSDLGKLEAMRQRSAAWGVYGGRCTGSQYTSDTGIFQN